MLTVFNRKELLATFSSAEQARVRELLAANGVDYQVKTVNRKSASSLSAGTRARTGSFGEDAALAYEYIIYVNKAEHEKALHLLRK